jgi:septum formation inhibitor MinC
MKAKVSYSVEFTKVPELLCEILSQVSDEVAELPCLFDAAAVHIKRSQYGSALQHLTYARESLTLLVQAVTEANDILVGYHNYEEQSPEETEEATPDVSSTTYSAAPTDPGGGGDG